MRLISFSFLFSILKGEMEVGRTGSPIQEHILLTHLSYPSPAAVTVWRFWVLCLWISSFSPAVSKVSFCRTWAHIQPNRVTPPQWSSHCKIYCFPIYAKYVRYSVSETYDSKLPIFGLSTAEVLTSLIENIY